MSPPLPPVAELVATEEPGEEPSLEFTERAEASA
jgi:hypothetical protein